VTRPGSIVPGLEGAPGPPPARPPDPGPGVAPLPPSIAPTQATVRHPDRTPMIPVRLVCIVGREPFPAAGRSLQSVFFDALPHFERKNFGLRGNCPWHRLVEEASRGKSFTETGTRPPGCLRALLHSPGHAAGLPAGHAARRGSGRRHPLGHRRRGGPLLGRLRSSLALRPVGAGARPRPRSQALARAPASRGGPARGRARVAGRGDGSAGRSGGPRRPEAPAAALPGRSERSQSRAGAAALLRGAAPGRHRRAVAAIPGRALRGLLAHPRGVAPMHGEGRQGEVMSESTSRTPFEAVLRLLDDQLEASEVSALAERLRSDESARRQAAGLLLHIGALGEMAREPDGAVLPALVRPGPPPSRVRRTLAAMA